MKKSLFALMRLLIIVIMSVSMIVVVGLMVKDFSKVDNIEGSSTQVPIVKFDDYKAFKNRSTVVKIDKTDTLKLKKQKEMFQEQFYKSNKEIFSNITKYATSLNQEKAKEDKFEEYLFMALSKYNYDLRISYLKQLSIQTNSLVTYGEEINKGSKDKVINWTDFLDWFTYDFDDQLESKEEVVKSQKTELTTASILETTVAKVLVFVLFIMMLLLITKEAPVKEDTAEEEEEQVSDETSIEETPAILEEEQVSEEITTEEESEVKKS